MAGVSAIGVYLPRAVVRETGATARRVAAGDEDALTLAVEATERCLEQVEPLTFGGLFFASTTAPFRETPLSSVIATACDLPRDIVTADFGGSARAGLSALLSAIRAVEGGVRRILVVAADQGREEGGDGAVAAVVDAKGRLAQLLASAAVAEDFGFQSPAPAPDPERPLRDLAEVVERVINEYGVGPDELSSLAASGVSADVLARLAELAAVGDRIATEHFDTIGMLGTAEPLMRLAVALERATPGDRIVVAAGSHGAEAALFQIGDGAGSDACRPSLPSVAAAATNAADSAARVGPLVWHAGDDSEEGRPAGEPLRDSMRNTRLYGSRCAACGGVEFPEAASCSSCGAREGLEPAKLAKRGRVHSLDAAARARVELEGGGEIELDSTDASVSALEEGASIRLTLRRASTSAAARYVWKVRPE